MAVYTQIPLSAEEALQLAATEFVQRAGVTGPEKHSEYIVRIAKAFVDVENPKKAEKILRELEYDALLMDSLEERIMGYMSLRTGSSPFRALWKSICKLLLKLQLQDSVSFYQVIKGIVERPVVFKSEKFYEGNFFDLVKEGIGADNLNVHHFLRDLYCLNHQVGKNPSGKGEHVVLLFTKDAERASDIRTEIEYEIKTSGAPVGENLGSKHLYRQALTDFFSACSCELDYRTLSFGSRDFEKRWFPVFSKFSGDHPASAKDFLDYQHSFYLQKEPSAEFTDLVNKFLSSLSLDSLCEVYDKICVEYVRSALGSKGMIVFEEEPTGRFFCFQCELTDFSLSFAGSRRKTPLKLFLPKSSATMRPEIFTNFDFVLSLEKESNDVSNSENLRGSGGHPVLGVEDNQRGSPSDSGNVERAFASGQSL